MVHGADTSYDKQQKKYVEELREKAAKLDPKSREFFELIKRDPLSNDELVTVKKIIKKDERLKKLIEDYSFEIRGVTFSGNANVLPVVWYPVVHFGNDSDSVAVKLNLDTKDILMAKEYKPDRLDLNNAYAVDEYDGSQSIVRGITVTAKDHPDYVGNITAGHAALVLNAEMYGSNINNVCSSAYFPSSYVLQVGMKFNNAGWVYAIADTTTSCMSMGIYTFQIHNKTDDVKMSIYSGSTWWVVLHNESINDFEYYSQSGMNSGFIEKGDETTSVFFENAYTTSDWVPQFRSGHLLSLTDAQVQLSNNSWIDWDGNSQYILDCNGNVESNNVISGTLKSGGVATWDLSVMESWPKC